MMAVLTPDLIVLVGSAILTALFIVLLFPLLHRYALARPNARSSHRTPTPQGGGIAVILAAMVMLGATALLAPHILTTPGRLLVVLATSAALAVMGAIDDIRPMNPGPRLLLQTIAVVVVMTALPPSLHILTQVPWWIERAVMGLGLLWFVNLFNFMDGIDWMTVVEVVPITAALTYFGWRDALPMEATMVAVVLCGATIGFAPFNKPVARLFLGDVGSLPLGLLTGWLLILLAERHLASAVLLPLYYIADASITLLRRFLRGEQITQAHRAHFYQQAVDGGMSVRQAVFRVFLVNLVLSVLADVARHSASWLQALALIAGAAVVGALLVGFSRRKPR